VPAAEVPVGAATGKRLEDRNIRCLYYDIAWQGLIVAGINSFLPVFLVRLGASNTEVGLLSSLPALATILFSIPAAVFVEGRRDLVRIVSVTRFFVRLCYILVALVPFVFTGELIALAPAAIVAIWTLSAAFSSATTPAWTTVIAAVVPPRRRPMVNGTRWALHAAIVAVAVGIFGRLLDMVDFPENYQLLFVLSFVAGLVSIYYFGRIRIPDNPEKPVGEKAFSPLQYFLGMPRAFANRPDFLRYLLSTFVYRVGLNLPVAIFPIFWVKDLNATDTVIGLRTTAGYAALVLAYFLWGRLASRRGHHRGLLACSVGLSFYPMLTGVIQSPLWLVPAALVWGFFSAGIDVSFFAGLRDSCPPNQRTSFAAANATFANLAAFVGPLVGAALADWIGLRPFFFVAGGFNLIGALLLYLLIIRRHEGPPLLQKAYVK